MCVIGGASGGQISSTTEPHHLTLASGSYLNWKILRVNDMSEPVHIVSRVLRTVLRLGADQRKIEKNRIDAARTAVRGVNDRVLELAFSNKDAEATELLLKTAAHRVNTRHLSIRIA